MKKAHRDRDQSVRGHSALTKAEQFSPVAWSVATMRTVLVDGRFRAPADVRDFSTQGSLAGASCAVRASIPRLRLMRPTDYQTFPTAFVPGFLGLGTRRNPVLALTSRRGVTGLRLPAYPTAIRWGGYLTSHALPVLSRSGNSLTTHLSGSESARCEVGIKKGPNRSPSLF